MRALLQRVKRARVTTEGRLLGEIESGLLVLLSVGAGDTRAVFPKMADKIVNLRIFEDAEGKMNRSVRETGGGILFVSQFTLHADCRRGRRPGFTGAAPPAEARALFDEFVAYVRAQFPGPVATGEFGAMMEIELVNSGPVTIWLDSDELLRGGEEPN